MAASSSSHSQSPCAPVCLILGMAGSGKTTLVDALSAWLDDDNESPSPPPASDSHSTPPSGSYIVNLDPAVLSLPYEPNVDIRDTLKFKDVMRDYSLGPNGAIITSLNMYATRFDQVLTLVERRSKEVELVLFDTPGQIETFTWSASGAIITDTLAFSLPTVVLFVVDTERSRSAMTFVSNMLYACSVMYKTNLPMVIVFNKTDVVSCKFAQAWMDDFDAFDAALKEDNFVGTLARSMAMALEEFYKNMTSVGVSAVTGEGMDELIRAIRKATEEYETEYRPALEERKKLRREQEEQRQRASIDQFELDRNEEHNTSWAPRNVGDEDDKDAEEEEEQFTASEQLQNARMRRMTAARGPDEQEDKDAYDNLVQYLEGLNTGKL